MTKMITSAVVGLLVLLTGAVVGFPSQASAATCISIYRIYYNSPGSDTGSNTSLNGEWIQLHNHCATARSLTNVRVKDAARHTYTFGTYALGGGR